MAGTETEGQPLPAWKNQFSLPLPMGECAPGVGGCGPPAGTEHTIIGTLPPRSLHTDVSEGSLNFCGKFIF